MSKIQMMLLLVMFAAMALVPAIVSLGQTTAPAGARPPADVIVAADGSGQFTTVQAAVDAAPANRTAPFVIFIKPGTYKSHLEIPKDKPFLTFRGEDAYTTILTDDRNVNAVDDKGVKLTTPVSSSTLLQGTDFCAENITFENTAGNHGQAMALYINADRARFRHCRFLGWQDTLRLNTGRSYFDTCYIEGHVDFIYGKGSGYFEQCSINCLAEGYITAAATPEDVKYGYVFDYCVISTAAGVKRTYLGRPWRPFAAVTFMNTEMPAEIAPEGWDNWGNPDNEKSARYAEFNSGGSGARSDARVKWSKQLTADEAKAISVSSVIGGTDKWSPAFPRAAIRIVLAGDSTVTDHAGWGVPFARVLHGDIECINLSRGGRSSKSYTDEGHWKSVLAAKPDYVLIQFGHNDEPGKGAARETIPQTTYKQYMGAFIDQARAAGIKPIIVTSISRRKYDENGKIVSSLQVYADAAKELAAEKKVPVVDLQASSIALYNKLGPGGFDKYSPVSADGKVDTTHLNSSGAEVIAALVIQDLKQAVPELAPYLK